MDHVPIPLYLITGIIRVCQKNKILENCKCTLISWTHGPNKVKNSKGVYHFDVNLARAFAFKFTKGKVKFIKGKCEIFVFCPFCLKISINFYFESHESNVPIDTVLLIPILLYILTFHVMSWMSQNVTKWHFWPFYDILWHQWHWHLLLWWGCLVNWIHMNQK